MTRYQIIGDRKSLPLHILCILKDENYHLVLDLEEDDLTWMKVEETEISPIKLNYVREKCT